MRTAPILIFVVVTGTGGEICLTHAMKLLGDARDFILCHARATRELALARRAADDGIVLLLPDDALLVSREFCNPRDLAGLRGRGVWREDFSWRAIERDTLGGDFVDLFRCGDGLGGRSAIIASLALRIYNYSLGHSRAGDRSSALLPRGNLFGVALFSSGASNLK